MKKIWYLVGLIMLLITIFQITDTYAKYVTEASGTAEKTAGAWVIKINNSDITGAGTVKTFTINNLTSVSNQYVASGKIAPSARGYFDITIDPTGTFTAVRFDVSIDYSQMTLSDSIVMDSAYKVVNNVENSAGMVQTQTGAYAGTISLAEVQAGTPVTARFYITWEDDGTGTNDADDTVLGMTQNANFSLPVSVQVTQYSGETIT